MKENMISTQWTAMQKDKGDLEDRCETYAKWTLDAICPEEGAERTEYVSSYVLIGPRLVNTLSNKIVESMFPHSRAFFAVGLGAEVEAKLLQEAGEEALADAMEDIRKESRSIEKRGMAMLDVVAYRPVAVQAAQHIIITGNACIRRMPDDARVVYGIKDFAVRRKINGDPAEAILRDNVRVSELPAEVRGEVRAKAAVKNQNTTVDDMECTLYTKFIEKTTGGTVVWEEYQEVDGVPVNGGRKIKQYSEIDMPLIFPIWSLSRGEHYARGLVEEHAKVFHNLDRTTESLFDIFEIVADIKFLVRPDSIIDIVSLNEGRRGSYHQGNKDDVSVPELDKRSDLQIMLQTSERMERELAAAFLLTAAGIRDAERVTAYEVREIALELETAYGGLYSKLAMAWQRREAEWVVSKLNVSKIGKDKIFKVTITTGMESLSKEGELQNFREALSDLQLFEGVPEDMRSGINPLKVAKFLFGQRNVKFEEFMYTADEQKQMQEAQQAQVQQQQQHEVAQKAATVQ